MNDQIKQWQQRLYYNLFATLPSVYKAKNFNLNSNFDFEFDNFNYFSNKYFWFTRGETKDKFLFLFGFRDKALSAIRVGDACLILDFDKNKQYNDSSLGLFSIKNSEIHILINNALLNEKYPYINLPNFKTNNYKSFDGTLNLEVIDLGNLNGDFTDNLEELIKQLHVIKLTEKDENSEKSNNENENTVEEQMDLVINAIKNGKSRTEAADLANISSNKIIEWYNEGKRGNGSENINFYKKFIEIRGISKNNTKQNEIVKVDAFGNKTTISQMNTIIDDLKEGKTENEAILHANVSKTTYQYWLNRGKQDFGKIYVQFFNSVNNIKSNQNELPSIEEEILDDEGIYEPLLVEYEDSINFKDKTGIAWVNRNENNWVYSRKINNETINLSAHTLVDLYKKVVGHNLIWGIIDYDKAKKVLSFPSDFVIPNTVVEDGFEYIDPNFYAPLSEEYERSFNSMNQSGIAWVNLIGNKLYYVKSINGRNIRFSADNAYDLFEKVKKEKQVWGIRDYDKASKFIDFPDGFEIPKRQEVVDVDEEFEIIDDSIFTPLSPEELSKFNSNLNNRTGIAWVYKVGANWVYKRQKNGKTVQIVDSDIVKLHQKVIKNNQVWGIFDFDKASKFIDFPDDFEIPEKPQVENTIDMENIKIDPNIFNPLSEEYERSFNSMNQSGIAWVNLIGNKLYYVKSSGGKSIRLSADNAYDLFEKVKKEKQVWGIRDYDKASKFIDFPDDFEIPEKLENTGGDEESEIDDSIYAVLSPNDLSKFNPNPNNKTGIAWVNKVGKNWIYQRQRNGKTIKFADPDIVKLHQKVIGNNQVWGIFDIDKATKVIETNSLVEPIEIKPSKIIKPIITSDVSVNYTDKSNGDFEILIKGVIKNKDIFTVLNRFELFKENIKRIIITSINTDSDIFIELTVKRYLLNTFEEKIEDLGWDMNK